MKKYKEILKIGVALFSLSAVLYFINYLMFGDAHHLFVLIAEELAYMPIYIFIILVVAETALSSREKQEISRKTNALVGTFYTEVGYELIRIITKYDKDCDKIKRELVNVENWDAVKTKTFIASAYQHQYCAPKGTEDLVIIKDLMLQKKDFMLELMSNTSLIEKDEFSELLLAVNHVLEEFRTRGELSTFDSADIGHLHVDVERAYRHLINGWVMYMMHLEKEYPYLFKLALRVNPFA